MQTNYILFLIDEKRDTKEVLSYEFHPDVETMLSDLMLLRERYKPEVFDSLLVELIPVEMIDTRRFSDLLEVIREEDELMSVVH